MSVYLDLAKPTDAEEIRDLLYPEYFNESVYSGLDYCPVSTMHQILDWFESGDAVIVGKDGLKIVSVLAFNMGRTYYKQPEIDVHMFFVSGAYRGTGLSRLMVEKVVETAELNKVGAIYSGCFSGIDEKNDLLYANLWGKYGFKKLGTVMIRVGNG